MRESLLRLPRVAARAHTHHSTSPRDPVSVFKPFVEHAVCMIIPTTNPFARYVGRGRKTAQYSIHRQPVGYSERVSTGGGTSTYLASCCKSGSQTSFTGARRVTKTCMLASSSGKQQANACMTTSAIDGRRSVLALAVLSPSSKVPIHGLNARIVSPDKRTHAHFRANGTRSTDYASDAQKEGVTDCSGGGVIKRVDDELARCRRLECVYSCTSLNKQ